MHAPRLRSSSVVCHRRACRIQCNADARGGGEGGWGSGRGGDGTSGRDNNRDKYSHRFQFIANEFFPVKVARVGEDGCVMLAKEEEREGQQQGSQLERAKYRESSEGGFRTMGSDARALVLWTGGDSLQVLLSQQQQRRRQWQTNNGSDSAAHHHHHQQEGNAPSPVHSLGAVAAAGRPLALSLVLSVLQGCNEEAGLDLILHRVAIVDIERNVFKARLFFGKRFGPTTWDIDCRPSDGLCLAFATQSPVYVSKAVWASHAMSIEKAFDSSSGLRSNARQELDALLNASPVDTFIDIDKRDPESVKFLKRCLHIALEEEDYAMAARIRDHPFMQIQLQIKEAMEKEDVLLANRLKRKLWEEVAKENRDLDENIIL